MASLIPQKDKTGLQLLQLCFALNRIIQIQSLSPVGTVLQHNFLAKEKIPAGISLMLLWKNQMQLPQGNLVQYVP